MSRTAAESAATSSGSPVTRIRRTVSSPPLTGGTSATSSPGAIRAPGPAYSRLIAATQERGASSMTASRSATVACSGSSISIVARARALAQACEETDGDEHGRAV